MAGKSWIVSRELGGGQELDSGQELDRGQELDIR